MTRARLMASGLALFLLAALARGEKEVASFSVGEVRPTGLIRHVAISPDGKQVAALVRGSNHEKEKHDTIRLWDIKAKKELARLPMAKGLGGGNAGEFFAYSPDGKQLVCTSVQAVFVYDLANRKLARSFPIRPAALGRAALSGDGKSLVCGDKQVSVYELTTGKELTTLAAPYPVYSIAVSHDGKRLVAGHYGAKIDRRITVWDIPSRTVLHQLKIEGSGHPVVMAFSADAKKLVVVSSDGPTALVYALDKPRVAASLHFEKSKMGNFDPKGVAFTPKGDKVVMAGRGKGSGVYVWEPATGKLHGRTGLPLPGEDETPYHISYSNGVGVSADRRTVVTGYTMVRVFDISKEVAPPKKP